MNPGITNFILIRLKINFITRTPNFNLTVVGEQKESDIRDQRSQKPLGDEFYLDHINKSISTLAPLFSPLRWWKKKENLIFVVSEPKTL